MVHFFCLLLHLESCPWAAATLCSPSKTSTFLWHKQAILGANRSFPEIILLNKRTPNFTFLSLHPASHSIEGNALGAAATMLLALPLNPVGCSAKQNVVLNRGHCILITQEEASLSSEHINCITWVVPQIWDFRKASAMYLISSYLFFSLDIWTH